MESVKSNIIPLQVKPEKRSLLLRHPAYKKRDVVDLFIEAKAYVQGGYPCPIRRPPSLSYSRVTRGAELTSPESRWLITGEGAADGENCGGVPAVGVRGENRSRRWMSRANVRWDPKICSTAPPGTPNPPPSNFPRGVARGGEKSGAEVG